MKRLFPIVIMLVGLFTISSAFNTAKANHFAIIELTGTEGDCTFTGQLNVLSLSNDGQSVVASGVLVGSIVNSVTGAVTAVNQQVSGISVSLDGTTCSTLNISTEEDIVVTTTCGNIELSATNDATFFYASRPGGQDNLIYNSLCAIMRYYENGNASMNSLFAFVNNLQRAITRE